MLYEMDFPIYELKEIPVTDATEQAFGARPIKAVPDPVCVFSSEGNSDANTDEGTGQVLAVQDD